MTKTKPNTAMTVYCTDHACPGHRLTQLQRNWERSNRRCVLLYNPIRVFGKQAQSQMIQRQGRKKTLCQRAQVMRPPPEQET